MWYYSAFCPGWAVGTLLLLYLGLIRSGEQEWIILGETILEVFVEAQTGGSKCGKAKGLVASLHEPRKVRRVTT